MLAPEPSAGTAIFFEELTKNRTVYPMMKRGPAWPEISLGLHEQIASHLLDNLQEVFGEARSDIPLDLLANYIAVAQFGFIRWWLEARAPYSPEEVARIAHSMRRAAIREALHL
ncbi:MAG: TetR family transcriptional regulator C-terminal domain-containing protein [Anaerolineae bacterium]|nr:TetR family transcriptional regulator C-terminal domain-containing protein [Anaerolineae bacterium]